MEPECSSPLLQVLASCPYAEPDQSSSCPNTTSWRSILALSSHPRMGFPSGLFPSGFSTRTLCIPLLSPVRATCPARLENSVSFENNVFGYPMSQSQIITLNFQWNHDIVKWRDVSNALSSKIFLFCYSNITRGQQGAFVLVIMFSDNVHPQFVSSFVGH